MSDTNFCRHCGSANVDWRIPVEDDRERLVCADCGEIHYSNPRNIAGCIAEHAGRILLCRRSIEPRQGYWTVPAGFMENGETLPEAAARETLEEAQAQATRLSLYALFSLPHISQVYVMFRAEVPDGAAAAGSQSEVHLIMNESDAVDRAIGEAKPGDFLLLLVDDITGTTERLKGRSFPVQADLAQA
jgi:ADP-ribose pyrophosphatase YjhB (NUDIX family)